MSARSLFSSRSDHFKERSPAEPYLLSRVHDSPAVSRQSKSVTTGILSFIVVQHCSWVFVFVSFQRLRIAQAAEEDGFSPCWHGEEALMSILNGVPCEWSVWWLTRLEWGNNLVSFVLEDFRQVSALRDTT